VLDEKGQQAVAFYPSRNLIREFVKARASGGNGEVCLHKRRMLKTTGARNIASTEDRIALLVDHQFRLGQRRFAGLLG
jgi:hypothetical protein